MKLLLVILVLCAFSGCNSYTNVTFCYKTCQEMQAENQVPCMEGCHRAEQQAVCVNGCAGEGWSSSDKARCTKECLKEFSQECLKCTCPLCPRCLPDNFQNPCAGGAC